MSAQALPLDAPGKARAANQQRARDLLAARLAQSYAIADFNGDGVLDVAFVDFLTDTVTVMTGDGTGHFSGPVRLAVPGGPRAIVAGDFNGDGLSDLAATSFFSGTVTVWLGLGRGEFADPGIIALAPGLTSIVTGDFDRNGHLDLAVANFLTGDLAVLAGGGGGLFDDARTTKRAPGLTLLAVRDEDGDGALDIFTLGVGDSASLLGGDGSGRFREIGPATATAVFNRDAAAQRASASNVAVGIVARPLSGDGQFAAVSRALPEPFVVGLRDDVGFAMAGKQVIFSLMGGAGALEEPRLRTSDELGKAIVTLSLGADAETHLVAASIGSGQPAIFGALSVLGLETFLEKLGTAAPGANLGDSSVADALFARIARKVRARDDVGIIADLTRYVQLLAANGTSPSAVQSTGADPRDSATRLLNQVLLIGSQGDIGATAATACDIPTCASIDVPGEVDSYTFVAVAGERVHITIASGTSLAPIWRLIGPAGTPVPGCGTFAGTTGLRDCTLPVLGTYTIEVTAAAVGTYCVHLQRLTAGHRCATGTLACDVAASNTISTPADTDLFRFAFATIANERVHVSVAPGTLAVPVWRLVDPNGAPVAGCNTLIGPSILRDCALTLPGVYAVEVMASNLVATGTYHVQVQRLTAGHRCPTGVLTCDVPASNTISTPADTDLFRFAFAAIANERVHVTVAPGTLALPVWRVVDPNGAPVAGCNTLVGPSIFRDCTLTIPGSYAVEVMASNLVSTGTYHVQVQRLTAAARCPTATLACDVAASNTISSPADTDLLQFAFAATAGERVHVSVARGTLALPVWRLVDPNGAPVAGCNTLIGPSIFRDCTLTTPGSYAVEVMASNLVATGTYHVQVQRLTAGHRCPTGVLTCDVPASNTISTPADTDLFRFAFAAIANERVHVTVAPGTLALPIWRLVGPTGAPVPGCATLIGPGISRDCTLLTAGSYAVEIMASNLVATGTYGVHVQRLTVRCSTKQACGSPVADTVEAAADTGLFSFAAAADGTVRISTTSLAFSTPIWRLVDASGAGVPNCTVLSSLRRDCIVTPGGSPYAVEVEDNNLVDTGAYTLSVTGACRLAVAATSMTRR